MLQDDGGSGAGRQGSTLRSIVLDASLSMQARMAWTVVHEWCAEYGHSPTQCEIAGRLGVSDRYVRTLLTELRESGIPVPTCGTSDPPHITIQDGTPVPRVRRPPTPPVPTTTALPTPRYPHAIVLGNGTSSPYSDAVGDNEAIAILLTAYGIGTTNGIVLDNGNAIILPMDNGIGSCSGGGGGSRRSGTQEPVRAMSHGRTAETTSPPVPGMPAERAQSARGGPGAYGGGGQPASVRRQRKPPSRASSHGQPELLLRAQPSEDEWLAGLRAAGIRPDLDLVAVRRKHVAWAAQKASRDGSRYAFEHQWLALENPGKVVAIDRALDAPRKDSQRANSGINSTVLELLRQEAEGRRQRAALANGRVGA